MDWELTKENCVPVRQGRSKAALQELADPRLEGLEAKRRELWAEVTDYRGDDPLEPWQRYIKWMQEYGVGGGKADLTKVLEACTKELQKYPRYTNDIRCLRIWIQYADCLADPDDVFLFLKEKGIGRDFALYYEAYGTYFELKGNFQAADAVYMDGIQRGVKQLERLKQKHMAFQQRMAQRVQRRIQDEQVMGPPPQEPLRVNLGTIGTRAAARGQLGQQQQSAAGIFSVAAVPQQPSRLFGPRPGAVQQERGQRPFVGLHEDEEFVIGDNPRPSLPGYSMMPQVIVDPCQIYLATQLNNLGELQPVGIRRKENLDRALAWNQAALLPGTAASAAAPASTASGIQVFTDEEFQDGEARRAGCLGQLEHGAPAALVGPSTGQSLLLPGASRLTAGAASGDVDALMFSLAPPVTLLHGLQPGPPHSVSQSVAALSISGKPTVAQQSKAPLDAQFAWAAAAGPLTDGGALSRGGHTTLPGVMPAGAQAEASAPSVTAAATDGSHEDGGAEEEMSYEELRAVAWFRGNPAPSHENRTGVVVYTPSGLGSSSMAHGAAQQPGADPQRAILPLLPPAVRNGANGAENASAAVVACGSARGEAASASAAPRRAPFGQVISAVLGGTGAPKQYMQSDNCTAALENGSAISNGGQQRRPLADAPPAAQAPSGHPPNGSVGTVFPTTPPFGLQDDPPPQLPKPTNNVSTKVCDDDPQPTVTISTRGAFDLINSLFSEDLPLQNERAERGQPRPCSTLADPLAPPAAIQPPAVVVEARPPWLEPKAAHSTSLPAPKQPLAAEPTVTLHTKLAFDALNDMFCDTLPHEEARKLSRRLASDGGNGTMPMKPISASDVCRLANAARSSRAAAPVIGRREPLSSSCGGFGGPHCGGQEISTVTAHGFIATASSLAIHEDTFFLGPATAAVCGDAVQGPGGPALQAGPPLSHVHNSVHQPDMRAMYEDTEFIPRGGNAVSASGSFILEDTEFVTRHHGPSMAGPSLGGYERATKAQGDSRTGTVPTTAPNARPGHRDLCAVRGGTRAATNGFHQRSAPKKSLQVYEDTHLFIYSSDRSHAVVVHSAGPAAHLMPPGLVNAVCHGGSHSLLFEGKKPLIHTQAAPLEPLPHDWFALDAVEGADSFLLLPLEGPEQLYGSVLFCINEADDGSCTGMHAIRTAYDLEELELLSQYLSVGLPTSATDLEVLQVLSDRAPPNPEAASAPRRFHPTGRPRHSSHSTHLLVLCCFLPVSDVPSPRPRLVANAATLIQRSLTIQEAVTSLVEALHTCMRLRTRLDLECLPAGVWGEGWEVSFRSFPVAAFFRAQPSAQQPTNTLLAQKQALIIQHHQHAAGCDAAAGGSPSSRILSGAKWLMDDASVLTGLGCGSGPLFMYGAAVPPDSDTAAAVADVQLQQQQQTPSRAWLQVATSAVHSSSGTGSGVRARLAACGQALAQRESMDAATIPSGGGGGGSQSLRGQVSMALTGLTGLPAAAAPGVRVRATTAMLHQTLLSQHINLLAAAAGTGNSIDGHVGPGSARSGFRAGAANQLLPTSVEAASALNAALGSKGSEGSRGVGSVAGSNPNTCVAAAAAAAVTSTATASRQAANIAVVPNCATFLMADERQPYKDILHVQRMLPQARAHSLVLVVTGPLERPQSPCSSSTDAQQMPLTGDGVTPRKFKQLESQHQQVKQQGRGADAPLSHRPAALQQPYTLGEPSMAPAAAVAAADATKRCLELYRGGSLHLATSAAANRATAAAAAAAASAASLPLVDIIALDATAQSSSAGLGGGGGSGALATSGGALSYPMAWLAVYLVSSESIPRVILDQVAEEAHQLLQVLHRPMAAALTGPYLVQEFVRFAMTALGKASAAGSGMGGVPAAAAAGAAATAAVPVPVSAASSLRPPSLVASHSLSHLHPSALEAGMQTHISTDTADDATTLSVVFDGAVNANTGTLSMMISSMRDVLSTVQLDRSPDFRPAALEDIYAVRLLRVIGRGGHGVFSRARLYNTPVAVKIIPSSDDADVAGPPHPHPSAAGGGGGGGGDSGGGGGGGGGGADGAEAAQKLQQRQKRWLLRDALEVAVTTTISHPHVVQVLNFFTDALVVEYSHNPGRYRLLPREDNPTGAAKEYCDAGTLKQAVDNGCFRLQRNGQQQQLDPDGGGGSAADMISGGGGGRSIAASAAALAAASLPAIQPPLSMVALLTSLLEVAAGLRHLHENRLVHCDIKPSNVLLRSCTADTRGWVCKLSDFGCVRLMTEVDPATGRPAFLSLSPVGSLSYMAPESMFRDTYLDTSIDIYSFGIMMWECAMGQLPYAGVSAQQLPSLVRRGLRPSFHPGVPLEYRQIACVSWAQDPRRRPTAAALVQLLQRLLVRTLEEVDMREVITTVRQQQQQQQQHANGDAARCMVKGPIEAYGATYAEGCWARGLTIFTVVQNGTYAEEQLLRCPRVEYVNRIWGVVLGVARGGEYAVAAKAVEGEAQPEAEAAALLRATSPTDGLRRPPADSQDPFGSIQAWIQTQHTEGIVIRRETWEKLLGRVRTAAQAGGALELLLRDAKVRDSSGWDWATHGYGQTAFQLVQVAAEAGAPEVAERLLEHREDLHLTLNKELVPSLIRKVAGATTETESAKGNGRGDVDVDACVEVVQRLYEQEAAYELSRVLRRAGDVQGVKSLHAQMRQEGLAVRDRLLEDIERWLAKRGVRVAAYAGRHSRGSCPAPKHRELAPHATCLPGSLEVPPVQMKVRTDRGHFHLWSTAKAKMACVVQQKAYAVYPACDVVPAL
ncbi:hypothetical protein VOLCADRAFT_104641 [Volvox carteri f. nagariensis]|uniref:BUB1 N-terminal domain-containing protein n=1 Tax=Volvox carteri f. nagariensis TaxID=3068 RepID=D8TVH8_VOLCA|nr:uncharacterized protein VOLCADRAFT_104641 [Volvox carteri f. nagariensis]EFJ48462.1 hypothetical protein VOLCADRAFT_104641 [Volvox carteri f. nagariensis]|eukprot:XP_002950261.1 hypothetical protein VOLCADRAFT_104641 [Volvox carteri f. nagariensis]